MLVGIESQAMPVGEIVADPFDATKGQDLIGNLALALASHLDGQALRPRHPDLNHL